MIRGAMLMRRVMAGMVEVPVRTRFGAGWREGEYASGYYEGSDEFLLHLHSCSLLHCLWDPRPGRGGPIESLIGRENGSLWCGDARSDAPNPIRTRHTCRDERSFSSERAQRNIASRAS